MDQINTKIATFMKPVLWVITSALIVGCNSIETRNTVTTGTVINTYHRAAPGLFVESRFVDREHPQWATIELRTRDVPQTSRYTVAKVPGPHAVAPGDTVTLRATNEADRVVATPDRSHRIVAVEAADTPDVLVTSTAR